MEVLIEKLKECKKHILRKWYGMLFRWRLWRLRKRVKAFAKAMAVRMKPAIKQCSVAFKNLAEELNL